MPPRSEFKYVPVRRLTDYIASSLYLGTQFAVFEPNDPDLWGAAPARGRHVHARPVPPGCVPAELEARPSRTASSSSATTRVNPQSEIDLGRVNVVVGFAPLKPAEFVVITITQISQLEA